MDIYLYIDWLLLLVISLGFCQQLFSKRFNLYGIASVLALASYIALHSYKTELNIFILLLFIGAIILIVLEMFVPGGILGIVGIITLLGAIIFINEETKNIAFIMIISAFLSIALYIINTKVLGRRLLFLNRFILNDAITTEDGYVAKQSELHLIGEVLEAYTDLRPAGTAVLNNSKLDVVTEGDFIEKGQKIEVIRVEGMRVVVRKLI